LTSDFGLVDTEVTIGCCCSCVDALFESRVPSDESRFFENGQLQPIWRKHTARNNTLIFRNASFRRFRFLDTKKPFLPLNGARKGLP
jgi:hypothetical protein